MATTMFFEGPVRDKENGVELQLEFGRSSFYDGESLMYLIIDDKTVILSREDGEKLYESMQSLAIYLGYEKGTTIEAA